MTDDEPDTTDDEQLADVDAALQDAGFTEPDEDSADEPNDEGRVGGLLGKLGDMSGTGKSLDAYENDPIAGIWARDDGEVPRGAKHIARGVDGLSPFAAAHPFIDIAVGFVLLSADSETDGGLFGDNPTDNPGDDDLDSRGDMLT